MNNKLAFCIVIFLLTLTVVSSSCGIHPMDSSASETPIMDTDSAELVTEYVPSTEKVIFENNGTITGNLATLILEDGRYLDYQFQPSLLPEGHAEVRWQVEPSIDFENTYYYACSYAGEMMDLPILDPVMPTWPFEVTQEGYSKGMLTFNPYTGEVFWDVPEMNIYQRWVYNDEGIISVNSPDTPAHGWMLYLDPVNGLCISETEYTVFEHHIYRIWEHPDFVPESIDLEAMGLTVPKEEDLAK